MYKGLKSRNVKLSWLIKEKINKTNLSKLAKIKGTQICPPAELISENDIKLAKEFGFGVRLWGVKNEELMKKVYKLDIEGMTANFPDKLKLLMDGE